MTLNFRTPANNHWLLVIIWVVFTTQAATAQCPGGSFSNTAGTFTNGQTVCITTGFSGAIQLNNGATMVVINGGNYTGNLDANNGSTIQIQVGGAFAPGQANNFAGNITNNGTVNINNISLSNGASVTNNGSFTWSSNWNQNNPITLSNTACGAMTFSQGTNVGSNAVITNNGVLNFAQGLTTSSGTTINNRGRVTVNGDINIAGLFRNQNIAVFKGSNNTISSNNIGDSLVNLGMITVTGSITTSIRTRNEGLMRVNGSYTINGNDFRINNTNAQVRVGGSFSNNGQVQGNGSLHVAGSIGNNQTVAGYGAGAQRLTVNQAVPPTTSNLNINGGLVGGDTATYVPTMSNPASCVVLPVRLSSLQAVYHNDQVQLSWFAYTQSDARSFTIEYSQDGQSFTVAGNVMANGTDNPTASYVYMHAPAFTGTVFYRVRETDLDGIMYYSNMVAIRTGNMLLTTTNVFPNPFIENLQISMQLEKAGMIQVALFNASGQLVGKLQQQGLKGQNAIAMSNLSALLPGTYLLQIKAGEHTTFEKLIK